MSGSKLDNRRMLAALIDLAVEGAGAAAILVAAGVLGGDGAALGAPLAAVVVGWALYYYFACESGGGQTLGKKLMNLRVVRVDGTPAGMREVAVRTALRVLDTLLVGLVAMLASGERRARVGDLAAGTMIVTADGSTAVAPAAATTSAPEAPELTPLSEAPDELMLVEAPLMEESVVTPLRDEPAVTPLVEESVVEPVVAESVALPAPEAPAVPELRPFEPFAEPAAVDEADASEVEVSSAWPSAAEAPEVEEDSILGEPIVEAPVAGEPVVELSVVKDPVVELSVVEAPPLGEPVAEEPLASADEHTLDIATPALKELADDVAAATGSAPAEVEPVVEVDEPEVTVRSVETVSAIDLIMGDDEPVQDSPAVDDAAPDAPLR